MKPVLTLFVFLIGTPISHCSTTPIVVGGTQLTIPSPTGFAPVTPEMTRLLNQLDLFVVPVNQRFLWFLDEVELGKGKTGRAPSTARSFSVQCAKRTIESFVTKSDFAKLKKVLREQNADLLKKAAKQMPGYLKEVNKSIQKESVGNGTLGIDGYAPAGDPEETERSISWPMLIKYNVTGADGKQSAGTGGVVTAFLHLKGKLIVLYCNVEESDLPWARTLSKEWASAIVAANPSDATTAARESVGSGTGYDWKAVPLYVIFLGVVSLVLSFLKWRRRGGSAR